MRIRKALAASAFCQVIVDGALQAPRHNHAPFCPSTQALIRTLEAFA
jgi:hypothetical protein